MAQSRRSREDTSVWEFTTHSFVKAHSADLQSFAIHISCVATPKLVQIYITVGSMRKYGSGPAKQTRVWAEVSGGMDGL